MSAQVWAVPKDQFEEITSACRLMRRGMIPLRTPLPPSGLPPRDSTDEDAHLHGASGDAPKYDGFNAHDYLPGDGKGDKAPGYEFATSTDSKSRGFDDDDDDIASHGPRVRNNNPFH